MANNYSIYGVVGKILEEEIVSDSFKKRILVVNVTDGQYEQQIPIEFLQDKTSILDQINVGDKVIVSVNLRGREYNGRYYPSIVGWKVEQKIYGGASNNNNSQSRGNDDLPF